MRQNCFDENAKKVTSGYHPRHHRRSGRRTVLFESFDCNFLWFSPSVLVRIVHVGAVPILIHFDERDDAVITISASVRFIQFLTWPRHQLPPSNPPRRLRRPRLAANPRSVPRPTLLTSTRSSSRCTLIRVSPRRECPSWTPLSTISSNVSPPRLESWLPTTRRLRCTYHTTGPNLISCQVRRLTRISNPFQVEQRNPNGCPSYAPRWAREACCFWGDQGCHQVLLCLNIPSQPCNLVQVPHRHQLPSSSTNNRIFQNPLKQQSLLLPSFVILSSPKDENRLDPLKFPNQVNQYVLRSMRKLIALLKANEVPQRVLGAQSSTRLYDRLILMINAQTPLSQIVCSYSVVFINGALLTFLGVTKVSS